MRRVGMLCLVLLSACGQSAPPTDYPATVTVLEATAVAQSTAVARGQIETLALGEQVAALRATATAVALRPTPTAQTITITVAGPLLSTTVELSSTSALSSALTLGSGDCGPLPPDVIDHEDAGGYLDAATTVQGRVIMVGRAKQAVFLNFHDPYQGYFSGVIFISAWKQFAGRFEDLYTGRCVRIAGTIKEYKGAPEIIIESPAQIEVLP
ncbi:MAG: OB-fold nucleic acid binding domain-containing protein [Herpetosiphonaceae bacterium]|nr:OB-fold nucleic acid binding domain-containing protein [Herpetosiphonaceae bacterium]